MYIKPSVIPEKILICLNRAGRAESLGNDDISAPNAPKYEMIRDGVKQKMPEGTPWFEWTPWFEFVTVTLQTSFVLHVPSAILWRSFIDGNKEKLTFSSLCLISLAQTSIINPLTMEEKS